MTTQKKRPDKADLALAALRLKRLRDFAGMSQAELGKRAGVGRNTVVRYETGSFGHMASLDKILRALNMTFSELVAPDEDFEVQMLSKAFSPTRDDTFRPMNEGQRTEFATRMKSRLKRIDTEMKFLEKHDSQLREKDIKDFGSGAGESGYAPQWRSVILPHESDPEITRAAKLVADLANEAATREAIILLLDSADEERRRHMIGLLRGFVAMWLTEVEIPLSQRRT